MLHSVNLTVISSGESHYLQHVVMIQVITLEYFDDRVYSLSQVSKLPLFETGSGFQGSLERFQNEQLMNTSLYQDLHNQGTTGFQFIICNC